MVELQQLIAPSFYAIHHDLKQKRHTHYWLKGGRGSTKSSFISLEMILGMMKDPQANAVVLRKVGQTLQGSVYEQLQWAIQALGVEAYWTNKLNPLEMKYINGNKIVFRGADKPKKIKSTKFSKGYCKYVWFEEVDEFAGMEEIRTINQSLLRGGENFVVFYSYNPPQSQSNWVNEEVLGQRSDRLVHHSTYLTVPREWLGEQFLIEAEHLQKVKPTAYQHEYLGEVTGTGGEVFTNLTIREMTDEEISHFDHIARGIDWGYAADPFHYTVNHYDKTRRKLYIYYEIQMLKLSNRKAAELVKKENKQNNVIICDSAEPKSIAEMYSYNLRVLGAKKGADSVEYGIKWLQDLEEIVIDPKRCPNTAREFLEYEIEKDTNGNFRGCFSDKNNHSIDAVRYSREFDMRNIKIG
ncbi:MAG: PBSX family phage terminase large subunit [Candidatus Gastranaerophilales bacterium]|nr:PBSX family phage terminase large subunit [Candidatus Gastranaerophilales bacterium]